METIPPLTFILGLLILIGLLLGLTASRVGFPRVAAYVFAGMLFSPDVLGGLIGVSVGGWADNLTSFSLGIIAYLIGGSFSLAQFRRIGRVIFGIALGESFDRVAELSN